MRLNSRCATVFRAGVSALALSMVTPALAQTTSAPDAGPTAADTQYSGGIQDIVVTAQRREEGLQDVPIAITAITAETAQVLGVNTTEGLTFATPSLDVSRGTFNSAIFLRGVGSLNSTTGAESSVAIYVDGVYMQSQQAGVFNFNNIDRVEVLKGPQGTLFGRNATGGVINVVTRTPSQNTSVEARAGYGNFDTYEAQAYATTGLGSNAAMDIALYYRKQNDGWGRNLTTGNDVFTNQHFGVRSKFRFEAGEDTVITLAGDYYRNRDQLGSALNIAEGSFGIDGTGNPGFYNVRSTTDDDAVSKKFGGSATVEHDFGDLRLLSITAYREMDGKYVLDPDRVAGYFTHLSLTTKGRTFTQELQLQSGAGSAVDWIAGLYYLRDITTDEPNQFIFGNGGTRPTSTRELRGATNLRSYAAFGQATFNLTSRTRFTAGLRYTIDKRSLSSMIISGTFPAATAPEPVTLDDFPLTPGSPVITYPNVAPPVTFKKLTWRASLDHHFTDDVMVYASYNRGFRGGLYSTSSPTDPAARPEVIDAYEIGFKADLLDRRLRLNGGAFYYDFKDLQFAVNVAEAGTFRSVLFNAAKARIWGLEGEIVAMPVDNLTISAAVSYLNGEYTYFPTGTVNVPNPTTGRGNITLNNVDLSGRDTIRTPPFTANVSIVYDIPVGDGGLQLAGMYYHNSGFFWALDYRMKQPAYDIVNATVTWTAPSGRWDVQLWAKNLLDVEYASYANATGAADQVSPAAPRTYGVSFGVRF